MLHLRLLRRSIVACGFAAGFLASLVFCTPLHAYAFLVDVEIVPTADSDGSNASTMTHAQAIQEIAKMNTIWARNGGKIRFRLSPAADLNKVVQNTLLNNDCILQPGMNERTIPLLTDSEIDRNSLCDYDGPHSERTSFAAARADRIIVFSRGGNDSVKYDEEDGNWVLSSTSGGYSWLDSWYVVMPANFSGDPTLLSHEVGHYLNAAHPFDDAYKPQNTVEAAQMMADWLVDHPGDDPRNVFDYDARSKYAVHDTRPDPGVGMFVSAFLGTHCEPENDSVTVLLKVDGVTTYQKLTPDRANVMSYFKLCPGFDFHLSEDQLANASYALTHGTRKHLLDLSGDSCYGGGGGGGQSGRGASPVELLKASLRKIANCTLLAKKVMPWEMVMGEIYSNPADRRPGYRRFENVAVQETLEQRLVTTILEVPEVIVE